MADTTGRLALPYPEDADMADVPTWMHNLALDLEAQVPTDAQGAIGSRPAAGVQGRYYTSTNEGAQPITYRDDGATWRRVSGVIPRGTTLPTNPADADMYFWQPPAGGSYMSAVTWLMRYAVATNRWEFAGGPRILLRREDTVVSTVILPSVVGVGPSYIIPKLGMWDFRWGGWVAISGPASAGYAQLVLYVGGGNYGFAAQQQLPAGSASEVQSAWQQEALAGVTAQLAIGHISSGHGASVLNRWLEVSPVWVANTP
jgi:hypothetical protein